MTPAGNRFFGRMVNGVVVFFTVNVWLKIVAILLTTLIYLSIRSQLDSTINVHNVPVLVRTSGARTLMDDKPILVSVALRGSKSLLGKVSNNDITIQVDTKNAEALPDGKFYRLKLSSAKIETPFGTRVKSLKPEAITLALDDMASAMVKVVPAFADRDKLPPEYTLGKVTVSPAEVRAEAPASKLSALKRVSTTPIPLGDITRSFDCDQELDQVNYPKFRFTPSKVLVQVEILPSSLTRTFSALPVRILALPSAGARPMACEIVSAPTVNITVAGAKNVIETLRKEDLFPYVDISRFTQSGLYRIDVRCAFERGGIRSAVVQPPGIEVKLEKK